MQLLISLRNRSHQRYANLDRSMSLQIDVPSEGTVNDIVEALSKRIDVPKILGGGTSLRSLLLGPQTKVINAKCENCDEETFAEFNFKCVICDKVAVPLTHVRGYGGKGECSICGDETMKSWCDFFAFLVGSFVDRLIEMTSAYVRRTMQPNSQSRAHAVRVQTVECPPNEMGDVHIYIAFIVVLIGALYVLNHGQRNVSGTIGLINVFALGL
uniref:Ubiquitin-like domain-containing protein n=1 Tax=Parascaris equorum TaxID=6256 RepID=A0A914SA85_PAREQ